MEAAELREPEAVPDIAGPAGADTGDRQDPDPSPGPIPQRTLLFSTVVDKFLEALMEAGSYQRFAQSYLRFYKFQPEMTRSIYNQCISQLQASIKDEIQEIKDEGNLEALLDSLDKMDEETRGRTDLAWRPSGVPEEDLRSHIGPYLLKQRDYLRKALKERQEGNAKLAQSVLAGRQRIEETQREIEKRKEAWQALSKAQRELVLSIQEPK